nr:ketoacyl-ACP synthase III [uncultured Cellulosilyticum sp.]
MSDQMIEKERLASMGVEIIGLGHYLPKRKVLNEEILSSITLKASSVDDKVLGNIGVESRYWANEEETVVYMAKEAAKMAIDMAQIKAEDIDLLLLTNWTSRETIPDLAPQVALQLNAHNALAFDLCTACCGFIHAVTTACMYLLSHPRMQTAVVACSEQFSKCVRPHSKGELITGDAAGAVVLKKSNNKVNGIIDFDLRSDGRLSYVVGVKKPEIWVRSKPELATVAAEKNKEAVNYIFSRNDLKVEDIDWFVPHPGTERVHEEIKEYIGLPDEKFVINFKEVANTSSASIPLVLSINYHNGKFKKNDLILSPAIGSGLYYGALLFRL